MEHPAGAAVFKQCGMACPVHDGSQDALWPLVRERQSRTKSMKPRSTSVWTSLTWTRSPTSRPWNPRSRHHRLQKPLRDEIGEAPIRRRGVRVVLHRQPEVSGRLAAWWIERVLSSPDELDHGQGEVGELLRVSLASPGEEGFEGHGIRLVGELVPEPGRELRDAVPAFRGPQNPAEGRKSLRFEVGRGHSVGRNHGVLDQLLCPVLTIQLEIVEDVAGEDCLRLDRLEAERAVAVPQLHEPLPEAVLEAEVVLRDAWPSIADPFRTSASTSATATRILNRPPSSDSATVSWSRSRESSLSMDAHS
jgi:hypothetical protein